MGWLVLGTMAFLNAAAAAQDPAGSIRGVVSDKDFAAPLPAAQVLIVETGQKTVSGDQGNYVFGQVAPGRYTLIFSKDDFVRQIRPDVVVLSGQLTDVDAALAGEFTDMEEFVVQDLLQLDAGTEAAVLDIRFASPALMGGVSSELMSQAGASDAASALRLVAGATVKDGKSAVIRGLPDRYISSQLNGVRLPSADEDKRAVELDQFPAAVIDSIQVAKTFTPDQQGDASGGAVDVQLKGIPDEAGIEIKAQTSQNSQVDGSDFLTYEGGGLSTLGKNTGRGIQEWHLGESWDGAVGVSLGEVPTDSKWSIAGGGSTDLGSGVKVGGFASLFYEKDSSYYDNGKDDSYWVDVPGEGMVPETNQGTPSDGDFKTALFDVTQGSQSVQLGGLTTLGLETEDHEVGLTYLYSRTAEDTATLAEDTRGKEYFFPGYDPDDPLSEGNEKDNRNSAPYLRLETLEYTERSTASLQLDGQHVLPVGSFSVGDAFKFLRPEMDWVISRSSADLDQPDKRQFASLWLGPSYNPGIPPYIDPFTSPAEYFPYLPGANFNLGNLQRIWKTIEEESDQYAVNLKFPFEQWNGGEGYLKTGVFEDRVSRDFNQDTYSNFGDGGASFEGGWDEYWSEFFPEEDHPITESLTDVDYKGEQKIAAWYTMMDLPISREISLVGGARFESTDIGIVNDPEEDALWFPPGATAPVTLNPGDADVAFGQNDTLPALALIATPFDKVTLRGSYSQTIARQTFKELTPIIQQEFLGGPIFIGNPELGMSALENYDLRVDYAPAQGSLLSASWFQKDLDDPIEYVQRVVGFTYTTAVNYPKGELSGYELELRQDLGTYWGAVKGLAIGANATFIDSEVSLPDDEIAGFELPNIQAPMTSRDMTNAPEFLYNLFLTYDLDVTGTQFGIFYTVQGDTLIVGAGQANGNFVPSVYAKEYDSLNVSVSQRLGKYFKLQLQAKNLTNPLIQTVYRSEYIGADVDKSSFTRGIEYSISLAAEIAF
jgi:TonB-dependent receptor